MTQGLSSSMILNQRGNQIIKEEKMKGSSVMKNLCAMSVVFTILTLNGLVMAQIYYGTSGKVGIGTKTPAEKLDIDGGLRLGNTASKNAGTIRWNGSNFEGYDGSSWLKLTGGSGGSSLWTDAGSYIYADNAANVAVTDNGNVGIGTTSPTQKLEIAGKLKLTGTGNGIVFPDGTVQTTAVWDGDGPSIWSLNGTSAYYNSGNVGIGTASPDTLGLTIAGPQDRGGVLNLWADEGDDNADKARIYSWTNGGINFETYDSGSWATLVSFRNSGNVGIGTTNPGAGGAGIGRLLEVSGSSGSTLLLRHTGANGGLMGITSEVIGSTPVMGFYNSPNLTMSITNVGYVGIGTTSPSYKLHVIGDIAHNGGCFTPSDLRLKENITPFTNAIDKVSALRGIYFNLKGESPSKREVGVIAQEVEKVLPEVVSEDAQGYKSVDYSKLTPLLIEATKAQQVQIELLKSQDEAKQAQIESQQSQIEALKALICQDHPEAEICQ